MTASDPDPAADPLDPLDPGPVDVAVVGAGVSGLHAADRLRRAGRSVRVLEARPRVGGRLLTLRGPATAGGPPLRLDLGASWHWPHEARVAGLLAELGLEAFAHHEAGGALFDGPAGPGPLPPGAMASAARRVRGGYAAVTEALAERLGPGELALDAAVGSVRHLGATGGFRVRTRRGAVRAAWVLVALPPALAEHAIAFDPPLAPVTAAAARRTPVWMGDTVKTVAVYDRPFWREAGLSGAAFSHRGPLREVHDLSGPDGGPGALFGFSPAAPPGSTPGTPPGSAADHAAVLGQLVRLFGPEAASPLGVHALDWSREAQTCPPHAGRVRRDLPFGHPALAGAWGPDRLLGCSCETHPGHGHVEDALAASERAVARVLAGG